MYYREPRAPTDDDLVVIEGMARLAALAIERENMVNELRTSEERLRGAIESLQEGFALFDADDRLVALNDKYRDVNPAAQEIMERGGTFEEVIRANMDRGALVEDIGREEEFIQDRLKKHRNPKGPIIRRISDGSWYMLQEVKTPEGGTALSFIDITELKKTEEALVNSEERLRGAIESLQEGFVLFDAEDRLVTVNNVYRQINPDAQEFLEKRSHYEDLIRANIDRHGAAETDLIRRQHPYGVMVLKEALDRQTFAFDASCHAISDRRLGHRSPARAGYRRSCSRLSSARGSFARERR